MDRCWKVWIISFILLLFLQDFKNMLRQSHFNILSKHDLWLVSKRSTNN